MLNFWNNRGNNDQEQQDNAAETATEQAAGTTTPAETTTADASAPAAANATSTQTEQNRHYDPAVLAANLDEKTGVPGINDFVQDMLDDLRQKYIEYSQAQLEQRDSDLRDRDRTIAAHEATIELMKTQDEQKQSEITSLQEQHAKLLAEHEQVKAEHEKLKTEHANLQTEHAKTQGDLKMLQTEHEQLKQQAAQQASTPSPAADSSLELSSSSKYADRISKIDEGIQAKQKPDWGKRSDQALLRWGLPPISTDTIATNPQPASDHPMDPEVSERQLSAAFRSNDASAAVGSNNTGDAGIQAAATAIPQTASTDQILAQLEALKVEVSDLKSWRDSESTWRVNLEKELSVRGIYVNQQAAG